MAHDIAERKQAVEELRHAHDQLETRVTHRTKQLTDAKNLLHRVSDSSPDWSFAKTAIDHHR